MGILRGLTINGAENHSKQYFPLFTINLLLSSGCHFGKFVVLTAQMKAQKQKVSAVFLHFGIRGISMICCLRHGTTRAERVISTSAFQGLENFQLTYGKPHFYQRLLCSIPALQLKCRYWKYKEVDSTPIVMGDLSILPSGLLWKAKYRGLLTQKRPKKLAFKSYLILGFLTYILHGYPTINSLSALIVQPACSESPPASLHSSLHFEPPESYTN